MYVFAERHTDNKAHLKFEEEQDYWEGSGEELDMHGDEEEADMRAEEELMMQHRYMMVCLRCHLYCVLFRPLTVADYALVPQCLCL